MGISMQNPLVEIRSGERSTTKTTLPPWPDVNVIVDTLSKSVTEK